MPNSYFIGLTFSESSLDVIENDDFLEIAKKMPKNETSSSLVLKIGITDSMELHDWFESSQNGQSADSKHDMSIFLLDEYGHEAARWDFIECLPSKYVGAEITSNGNDVAIERLEIIFKSMKRTK